MARLNHAIDVTEEKGGLGEFEPVPAGVYPAQIVSAEEEPTKDGSSWVLKMQFSIVGPNYPGRRIWGRVMCIAGSEPNKNPGCVMSRPVKGRIGAMWLLAGCRPWVRKELIFISRFSHG